VVADGGSYDPRFGLLLSTAYATTLTVALEKAARETMSTLAFRTIAKQWTAMSLDEFLSSSKVGPREHGKYAIYPDKEEWLAYFFSNSPSSFSGYSELRNILVEDVELPSELLNPPLFACRASSEELQPLYFGMANSKVLNSERLNRFMGSSFSLLDTVETHPHFLD
jgi:hypothetical protein